MRRGPLQIHRAEPVPLREARGDGRRVACGVFQRTARSIRDHRIEQANATFGWADGNPSIYCHAVWIEPDGSRRGGRAELNLLVVDMREHVHEGRLMRGEIPVCITFDLTLEPVTW